MKAFQEKHDTLTKKVEDKKHIDDASDVDKAKREVKEEARWAEVNVDILHKKLLHLESVSRQTGHESVDKLNLILKRFHVHKKQNPAFVGNMVLAQISSKDDEAVLNKEQKFYKQYNMVYPWGSSNKAPSWGYGNIQNQMPGPFGPSSVGHLPLWPAPQTQPPYLMPQAQAYMTHPQMPQMQVQPYIAQQQTKHQPQWQASHYMPQLPMQPSQPRYNAPTFKPRQYPLPSKQQCFKCNKPGHFVRNCPLN